MTRGIVYDCIPTVCLVASVGVLTVLAWQVSDAFSDSHRVHVIRESVVAALVAEDAAFEAVDRFRPTPGRPVEKLRSFSVENPAGLKSRVDPVFESGRRSLRIAVAGKKGRSYTYECDLLPGAAPASLGNPLSVRHSVVAARPAIQAWLRRNLDIRLDPMDDRTLANLLDPEVVRVGGDKASTDFQEDSSIALLRLTAGTDRADYRTADSRVRPWRPKIPENGVRILAGNLWIAPGERPLCVELSRSLTVIVTGNIYFGRSVVVRGAGRLIFVARRGNEPTFVDLDGDGGFSPGDRRMEGSPRKSGGSYRGPVEGAGAIYLGLPGAGAVGGQSLEIEASLVSESETYVRATSTTVHGALVVGQGITWTKGTELHLPGDALPNIERAQVPGFRRSGATRPGMLISID